MASSVASTILRRAAVTAPRASIRVSTFAPRWSTQQQQQQRVARSFSSSVIPQIKKYTQDHEWIELDEGGEIGTIGISTYAAHALGDVVFVELPTTDLSVSIGDSIGAVESVKSASDIMTPVTGTIVDINTALEDKPSNINKDPEGEGWLAKIKIADKGELEGLMDEGAYKAFTEESTES